MPIITPSEASPNTSAPTLESMIHGAFVVADLLSTDKVARSGTQLLRAFGEFNDTATRTYEGSLIEMEARARQAIDEGDLRATLIPERSAKPSSPQCSARNCCRTPDARAPPSRSTLVRAGGRVVEFAERSQQLRSASATSVLEQVGDHERAMNHAFERRRRIR